MPIRFEQNNVQPIKLRAINSLASRLTNLCITLMLIIGSIPVAWANEDIDKVKAAYIYQFANFTTWPDKATNKKKNKDELTVGVIGDPITLEAFKSIEGKQTANGRIKIKVISKHEDIVDCCQIIFLADQDSRKMGLFLEKIKGEAVITILDKDCEIDSPVLIRFLQRGTRLRFFINSSEAKRSRLIFNSHMLRSAIDVF